MIEPLLEFHLVSADPRVRENVDRALELVGQSVARHLQTSLPPAIALTVSTSFEAFASTLEALATPNPSNPDPSNPDPRVGSGPNLLILDDAVLSPPLPAGEACTDSEASHWRRLELLVPAMPLVVLSDREPDIPAAAVVVSRSCLRERTLFARRVAHYLSARWEMPFWDALREYTTALRRDSWHTPGHAGGESFARSPFLQSFAEAYAPRDSLAFLCDLSVSVDELGDLSAPYRESPMARAMARSAATFGAARTLYATNGSSSSNKVVLTTLLDPGDVVVLDRNCHKSVHQAMVFAGTIPLYLNPLYSDDLGVSVPISCAQIENALADPALITALRPRVFGLTTSTYEGVLYPILEVAALCESAGMVFFADESWLPHGRFHPCYGPRPGGSAGRYNALGTGADDSAHLVVQSTHKTLSALSQASMMHVSPSFMRIIDEALAGGPQHPFAWLVKRFVDQDDFLDYLAEVSRYWVTTSPSYPIIASLDCATMQMEAEGLALLTRLLAIAADLQATARQLGAEVGLDELFGDRHEARMFRHDPLKFAVLVKPGRVAPAGPSHLEAFLDLLRRRGIAWEKASAATPEVDCDSAVAGGLVVFLVAAGTSTSHAEHLKSTLREGSAHLGRGANGCERLRLRPRFEGQVAVVPRDAHYAEGELVPLREAAGRISCQMVVPYPPGIPSILPGLKIPDHEAQQVLEIGTRAEYDVHGLVKRSGDYLIRVLRADEIEMLARRYAEGAPVVKQRLDFLAGYQSGR